MEKRVFAPARIDEIRFQAIETGSIDELWFVSYCLMVSEAEDFIIRSCAKSMRSQNNSALIGRLKQCFLQEKQHSMAHLGFNRKFLARRGWFRAFLQLNSWINYGVIERISPPRLKLAVAAAMEQMNSEVSYYGLSHPSLSADSAFLDLLRWHFVEEIEHREVVFDLIQELALSRLERALGVFFVLFSFCFWITSGALLIRLGCGSMRRDDFGLFKANGILQRLVRSAFRYLRKGYHPSMERIPEAFFMIQPSLDSLKPRYGNSVAGS